MSEPVVPAPAERAGHAGLVPRLEAGGYREDEVRERRVWLEGVAGCALPQVGGAALPSEQMRGNIENPIGTVQVPLGVVGPLVVRGEHAQGTFYVPFATTEGALVRSYERGAVALSRAGGVECRVVVDANQVAPSFRFDDVAAAVAFCRWLPEVFTELKAEAEATTRHGRLLAVEPRPVGREVAVLFRYHTADAHGMNMIVKATERACHWLLARSPARGVQVFSGLESEKRASGALFAGGKGKKVIAGARLPARVTSAYLHASPADFVALWHQTVLGHLQSASLGYTGHAANGIAAMFIACGQDVANLANAAVAITHFELTDDGDLYASVTLPSLTVATIGGGTQLGTAAECLAMLGCTGPGRAPKLAEIIAATVLGGELSMGGSIASGEFVQAHETYGRNRPAPAAGGDEEPG